MYLCTLADAARADAVARKKLAISAAVGISSASMSQFHRGVGQYITAIEGLNRDIAIDRVPKSRSVQSAEIRVRYHWRRYALIETGLALLHNRADTGLHVGATSGTLGYRNIAYEIPLLAGGYYPVHPRVDLHAAIGPTLLVGTRSNWNYDLGEVTSFSGARGGGLESTAGADVFATRSISAYLSVRYRFSKSGTLSPSDRLFPPIQPITEIDFSGFGVLVGVRVHSLQ